MGVVAEAGSRCGPALRCPRRGAGSESLAADAHSRSGPARAHAGPHPAGAKGGPESAAAPPRTADLTSPARATAGPTAPPPDFVRDLTFPGVSVGYLGRGGNRRVSPLASRRPEASQADTGHGVLDAAAGLPRALPGSLRLPLHAAPPGRAAVRDPVRPGRHQGSVHRAGGPAASRRGRSRPGAGGRPELGDPARRGRAHGAAQAHAARVPRRARGAAERPRGRGGRARGGPLARPDRDRAASVAPAPDARGGAAGRVRPRPGRAPRCRPRAPGGHADLRRSLHQPDSPAARRPGREGARARRPVHGVPAPPTRGGRAAVRAARRAPRRDQPARRRTRRCCSMPDMATARRCPTRSCATS